MKAVIFQISSLIIAIYILNLVLIINFDNEGKGEAGLSKDYDLGWTFSGYSHRGFNDVGIRHPKSSSEIKSISSPKVLFLGNSVVGGLALPWSQTFSHLTSLRINEFLGSTSYVFNGGQDGYEIYREFLKYKKDFASLGFDYVIWFPNTNDFQDKGSVFRNFVDNHQGKPSRKWISYFNLTTGFKLLSAKIKSLKETATENYLWSEKSKFYTNPLLNELNKHQLDELESEIESFVTLLKSNKVKLLAVLLPPHHFCKFHTWNEARSFIQLKTVLEDKRIKTINLFDKLPCRHKDLYKDYVHFNQKGHEVVAIELSNELVRYLK